MIEAKKLAFMDSDGRRADRYHMKVSVHGLLAQARVEKLRGQIQRDRAAHDYQPISAGTDTEYVAVADSDGNLVSFIQSNFMGFGPGVVEPETGISLQTRSLFSLDQPDPTDWAAQTLDAHAHARINHEGRQAVRRVRSRRRACSAAGSGQIIADLIDKGMTPQQAIWRPASNHIEGTKVGLEPEFFSDIRQELSRRGHQVVGGNPESFGGAHAILIHPDSGVSWRVRPAQRRTMR